SRSGLVGPLPLRLTLTRSHHPVQQSDARQRKVFGLYRDPLRPSTPRIAMSIELALSPSLVVAGTLAGPEPAHAEQRSAERLPAGTAQFDFDVAIVGRGYVGLPTALAMHLAGARVLGVDVSEQRLGVINRGDADLLDSD